MKENELLEETSKAKSAPQFNVRIDENLKQTIDEIANKTGKSKVDLLEEFVRVYQTKRADDEFADMDLSKYDNLSNPLKESVHNAFIHIINAVNGNLSTLKQAGIHIEEEKRELLEKEKSYRAEIDSIKSISNRDILALRTEKDEFALVMNSQVEFWKNKSIDLETKNKELSKEFNNVSQIAEQVQVVMTENKELRESSRKDEAKHKDSENDLIDQIKSLTKELAEAKQSAFRAYLENENKDKELEVFKEQLSLEKKESADGLNKLKNELAILNVELSATKNEYNKALGKLEILEKFGKLQ